MKLSLTLRFSARTCMAYGLACLAAGLSLGEVAAQTERLSTPHNSSSQRYEINQTFDGQAFEKDNNIWAYTKDFADLFGMPAKQIDNVQGISAVAFRIEDSSYQECGFGGNPDACQKVEYCLLDLYFDESKTPLPWATDLMSQWLPRYSSMRWLRPLESKEKPYGMVAPQIPAGIIRSESQIAPVVAFADPTSKWEAIFTTNTWSANGDAEAISGSLPLIGYTRHFYRQLSVVNLQFHCRTIARKDIDIRLDAKKSVPYGVPIARFNKVYLPEGFVHRLKEMQQARSDKNTIFYRSLFPTPLGTRGVQTTPGTQSHP